MPSVFAMAKNIIKDGSKIVKNKFELINSSEFEKRIQTCTTCEHVRVRGKEIRCSLCGCYMRQKARFKSAQCPRKLWVN